ncbi:hypothetical protein D3C85_1855350 [compost metagenome]
MERQAQVFHDSDSALGVVLGQEENEFLAAEARGVAQVGHMGTHGAGHAPQDVVAYEM